jgi:hypothetical protein
MCRTIHTLLAVAVALSVGIPADARTPTADPASTPVPAPLSANAPHYEVQSCCRLCPLAADPQAYAGSKFLDDFRVLVDGRDGWLFRTGLDLTTR